MTSSAFTPVAGTIGDYTVLDKIADGSMSTVHKARSRTTGELVAIKILSPQVAGDPVLLKRLEQEFRAASSIHHPNLVRALDFGWEGPAPYLVMEYVEGEDLWQRLEREGPLNEAAAVALIVQVAQALHKAHSQGIIHRDVKPENILVTANGQAKLADLGLAKDLEADAELTRPDKGLGTPNFIAPEQFSDAKHAGVRCDVYSLGATLYMTITGKLPFEARTLSTILKKKLNNELVPPRHLVSSVSEQVDWAIRRAMRADPTERHASCLELIAALTDSKSESSAAPQPRATSAVRPRGSPARTVAQERRVSVRYPCEVETECHHDTSLHSGTPELQESWEAAVKDLSLTGIGLILNRRFEPGSVLTVQIDSTDGQFSKTLEMIVNRVKRAARECWFLGCTFSHPLDKEELRKLVSRP
jgi:serine/threonine protein kinase